MNIFARLVTRIVRGRPSVGNGSSVDQMPPIRNRSGKTWTLVPQHIGSGPVVLVGGKREVEISEVVFCFALVAAKINGWRGGEELFRTVDGSEVLNRISDGMTVKNDEALELGVKYFDFIKTNSDGGNRGNFDEEFLRVCTEGGFSVERKGG